MTNLNLKVPKVRMKKIIKTTLSKVIIDKIKKTVF